MTDLRPPRSRLRLIGLPLVVLIIGGVFALQGAWRERARLARVERAVEVWCAAAGEGRPAVPTAVLFIERRVNDALAAVCAMEGERTMEVAAGPGPGEGVSQATHHAIVRVAGVDRLGLRIAFEDERPLVVGYWRSDG
jgi:hypothetical protein